MFYKKSQFYYLGGQIHEYIYVIFLLKIIHKTCIKGIILGDLFRKKGLGLFGGGKKIEKI
jgi:hypothetical protein